MKNILITGGAGYLGTELVQTLQNQQGIDKIRIYDNLSRGGYNLFLNPPVAHPHKIEFIQGDILDSRKLRKALEGIDMVIHLAALVTTPFANSDGHAFEQVNHWGTAELTYAVEDSEVQRLVYVSSTSVYGVSDKPFTENSTPHPATLYGTAKLRGEEHVRRLMEKMETVILRCGNVYGFSRSMRFDAVINQFTFDANFKRRISIHGNGKQNRAFIHIDLITKVLTELVSTRVPSGVYNVVDRNLQVLDVVDVLKGIYPDLEFIFINQHLGLRELSVATGSALREYIDYSNPHDLAEELISFTKQFSF